MLNMLNNSVPSDRSPIRIVDVVWTLRLGRRSTDLRITAIHHSLYDINHSSWSKLARAILQISKAFYMILFYDQVSHFLRLYGHTVSCANDGVMSNRGLVR